MTKANITGLHFHDPDWESEFESLAFTAEALLAHPDPDDAELGRLSRKATSVLGDWEEIDMEGRAAKRGALHTWAQLRAADVALDQAIGEFAGDLLAHVGGDRGSELYKRFFPEPHEEVIELGVDAQLPAATLILMSLDADAGLPDSLRKHHHALRVALQLGTRALTERADALAHMGRHFARIEAWKESALAMKRSLYRGISSVASERKLTDRWVRAFFLSPPKPS